MAIKPAPTFSTAPQEDLQALLGSVRIKTPEELQAAAEALYGPYFAQQLADLQAETGMAQNRLGEDFSLQQQQDLFANQIAGEQATGIYNDRFGSSFGSPLQQKLESQRLAQQNLQQTGQQRNFQRRQYDIGEILRKGQLANTQDRQRAVGEYVASNQFLGL